MPNAPAPSSPAPAPSATRAVVAYGLAVLALLAWAVAVGGRTDGLLLAALGVAALAGLGLLLWWRQVVERVRREAAAERDAAADRLRASEARLVRADRLAAVGTLAAGVAHEINNPLSYVLANIDFALAELARPGHDPGEVRHALEEARQGGGRVREIVRDLKLLSRDAEDHQVVDVARVLRSTVAVASNELRQRARLEVELAEVPPVLASEHRLGQVFLNLLVNAAQAIPEGHAAQHLVRVTARAEGGRVVVEISDSGPGIPPEVLPRIFDPFFTTKPVGVGTGLGLAVCHGIVASLGGEIAVETGDGRGTCFRVTLPAAPPGADPAVTEEAPAARRPPRRARVLVVDDEPLVGRAVRRILSPPHDVVIETSARAALDRVAGGDAAFDLVLCDLMMPELSGMELFEALRAAAPALPERVVFLTGGAFTPAAREFLAAVPNPRVEKPFDPEALRALAAERGAA